MKEKSFLVIADSYSWYIDAAKINPATAGGTLWCNGYFCFGQQINSFLQSLPNFVRNLILSIFDFHPGCLSATDLQKR